jgi:uncharacterized tellurite resistance protein B-like protein
MIFFGTRGLTLTGSSGNFLCPNCGKDQHYKRRRVRRFFTLYFVPIIPLDLLGEYIECTVCKNTYNDKVLELAADVEADRKAFESEYERAVRKSMAIMVLADGVVDESEIEAMTSIYNSITGKDASREDMSREIETTKNEGLAIENYLETINGQVNANGKELVVKALISIAYADGDFDEEEQKTLIKALGALDINENDFKRIMDDFKN